MYIYDNHHHRLYSPGWALASAWAFVTLFFLQGEVVSLMPNPKPGGPGYPFLSGSSPLTCLAWEALPVAYATTSIALGIIWPHKPRHYAKVRIPSGGMRRTYCVMIVNLAHWSSERCDYKNFSWKLVKKQTCSFCIIFNGNDFTLHIAHIVHNCSFSE